MIANSPEPTGLPVPETSSVIIHEMSEAESRAHDVANFLRYQATVAPSNMLVGPQMCTSSLVWNNSTVVVLPNGSPYPNDVPPFHDYRDVMLLSMQADVDQTCKLLQPTSP